MLDTHGVHLPSDICQPGIFRRISRPERIGHILAYSVECLGLRTPKLRTFWSGRHSPRSQHGSTENRLFFRRKQCICASLHSGIPTFPYRSVRIDCRCSPFQNNQLDSWSFRGSGRFLFHQPLFDRTSDPRSWICRIRQCPKTCTRSRTVSDALRETLWQGNKRRHTRQVRSSPRSRPRLSQRTNFQYDTLPFPENLGILRSQMRTRPRILLRATHTRPARDRSKRMLFAQC